MSRQAASTDAIVDLHADVDRVSRRLHVLHAARLQCRQGCTACCVDGLTVFDAEAERIRSRHSALLAGMPGPPGACAFLGEGGACRIYVDRPYVCRTQGLPLRWIDEDAEGGPVELRDICGLNDAGVPIESLNADDCWTIGPIEERLGVLQVAAGAGARRTRLRDLFSSASNGLPLDGGPSSTLIRNNVEANIMGDKSPKAKDKSKKQHDADKSQKHNAAVAKAKPSPTGGKGGK
jgi:uncharacterized protein